jgi:Tfp pilus assembly protein PilV
MKEHSRKDKDVPQYETEAMGERGFTLIETSIALLVMMVAALAMSSLFVYSMQNNVGGNERALAMAVAQQQLEQIRSVNFNDPTLAVGTTTLPTVRSGERNYTVVRRVVDETNPDGTSKSLRRITISVTPESGGPNWVRTPVILVSQRSTLASGNYAAPD